MLRHLLVRDFALVETLEIELRGGLTVITGESGAGKSILLGALGMVTGDRADTQNIRPGAQRSEVSAEFSLEGNEPALGFLNERGLADAEQPDRCLLRRVLSREGRSRAFINGSPVTRQELARLTAELIDIHSQNEHQALLRREVQLALLDDFAGHGELAGAVRRAYRDWQQARNRLAELQQRHEQAADRQALLDYQVAELDDLSLSDDEYASLDARFRRLAKGQELEQRVSAALAALEGESEGGIGEIERVGREIGDIQDEHDALQAARDLVQGALTHLGEAAGELRRYLDTLGSDPGELAELETRLDRITTLARKHRVRPESLPALHAALSEELGTLSDDRAELEELEQQEGRLAEGFRELAGRLSRARHEAAPRFEAEVSRQMRRLGIEKGRLELTFEERESENGLDAVEYRVVTNPKYPAAPLARIASGGERSRISLAIEVVAASRSRLPTLVLDEADIGIGGTTADIVGRLLRRIAERSQVLCVTHAPQLAALGEQHLGVVKDRAQDTRIEVLEGQARIAELARMLGGQEITEKTREYARELITAATAPAQ